MAMTNFKNIYKTNSSEYAYTTTDHAPTKTGESIPLYVPSLMPNINSGSPNIQTRITKGSVIFKNAIGNRPTALRRVQSQNYISSPMSRNQSWDGLSKTRHVGEEEEEYVPRKTSVLCTSAFSNTKNMNFSTDYTR